QPAAHVRADINLRPARRRQMKMRIKAGYAVDLVERNLAALRKVFQLCLRQVPMAQLDGSQFVKNHCELSRAPALPIAAARRARSGLGYFRTFASVPVLLIHNPLSFRAIPSKTASLPVDLYGFPTL